MKVGDYLEYSGIKSGDEIICYSITVNIGIYTNPGTAPGFILVEDAIVGIISGDPNVEFARTRVSSFPKVQKHRLIVCASYSSLALLQTHPRMLRYTRSTRIHALERRPID